MMDAGCDLVLKYSIGRFLFFESYILFNKKRPANAGLRCTNICKNYSTINSLVKAEVFRM